MGEEGKWHLHNAVKVEDVVYHPECYKDHQNKLQRDEENETPDTSNIEADMEADTNVIVKEETNEQEEQVVVKEEDQDMENERTEQEKAVVKEEQENVEEDLA